MLLKNKGIEIPLNILISLVVIILILVPVIYMIEGKDFKFKTEAGHSYKNLIKAVETVAENPTKYTFESPYGEPREDGTYNTEDGKPLVINLPDDVDAKGMNRIAQIIRDSLTGAGDPKFLVYYNSYDSVDDWYWSSWMTILALINFIPIEKGVEFAGKLLKNIGGKEVFKGLVEIGKKLGDKAPVINKFLKKSVEDAKLLRKGEVVTEEIAKEEFDDIMEILEKESLSEEGEEAVENLIKPKRDLYDEIENYYKSLREADIFKNPNDEKLLEEQARILGISKKDLQKLLEMQEKDSIKHMKLDIALKKAPEYRIISKEENRKAIDLLTKLSRDTKATLCVAGGTVGGILGVYAYEKINERRYDTQHLFSDLTPFLTLMVGSGEKIIQTKKDKKTIKAVEIDTTGIVLGKEKIKINGVEKEVTVLKRVEGDKLPLIYIPVGEEDNVEKWIMNIYEFKDGKLVIKEQKTIKEIMEDPKLATKVDANCGKMVAVSFAFATSLNLLDRKGEKLKNEEKVCKRRICIKKNDDVPKLLDIDQKDFDQKTQNVEAIKLVLVPYEEKSNLLRLIKEKEGKNKLVTDFYLASPCFAYGVIWAGDCNDMTKPVKEGEKFCIYVMLKKAYGLKYQQYARGKNYCAANYHVKEYEENTDLLAIAGILGCVALDALSLELLTPIIGFCFELTGATDVIKLFEAFWPGGGYWFDVGS